MTGTIQAVLLSSWLAGLAMFVGGALARLERIPESELKAEVIHGIVAFGGGVLVAAVAFVLAPTGLNALPLFASVFFFCAGAFVFMFLDRSLTRRRGSRAQFMAMLMDFVPEVISLGAVFAHNHALGMLLALFIGAQNLPEGFNAYRERSSSSMRSGQVLMAMLLLSLLGPAGSLTGYLFLQSQTQVVGALMVFAAGGILYLIFQDIAPQSKLQRHWTPPLGATLGFVVGMVGEKLLG
jgi:ZIP family zinc transporter